MSLELSGTTGVKGVAGSVSAPSIVGDDTNTGISFPSADTIKFSTGGVERMSITNSGVTGISGGKLLQTVTVSDSVRETSGSISIISSNTYYSTPFAVTITPSATSSKILLMGHIMGEATIDDYLIVWSIERAISGGATTDILAPAAGSRVRCISLANTNFYNSEVQSTPASINFSGLVDSPNTTSATTYTFQVAAPQNTSVGFYYNRSVTDTDNVNFERGLSWITAMEVTA